MKLQSREIVGEVFAQLLPLDFFCTKLAAIMKVQIPHSRKQTPPKNGMKKKSNSIIILQCDFAKLPTLLPLAIKTLAMFCGNENLASTITKYEYQSLITNLSFKSL